MKKLLREYIRSSSSVARACGELAKEDWLELADSWYESADSFSNEARQRYERYWGDRAALGRL